MTTPHASTASRSIGAMFFFVFGGAWLALWAHTEYSPNWFPVAAIVLVTAVLFACALRIYRQNQAGLAALAGTEQERRRSRWFNLINAAQWLVIIVSANLLVRVGLKEYVVPVVIFVIGIHFLPLAALFSYRPHYLTGIVLAIWPLAYATLGSPASSIGPLVTGIVLWCSAIWALRSSAVSSSENAA